ncbi:MAG TPA: stage II sporulation protein M [Verrucomicrobiae bacterium]|nr:stage II sporulation protein M [Verrucomicrobiae bacterium]
MDLKAFIKQNRSDWEQLEQSIREMSKGNRFLTPQGVESFQRLYRKVANQLSFSQTYFRNEEVTNYLNELVAKAHNLLYRDQATTSLYQLKQFFGKTFIRLLLEQRKFVLAAFLLFLIGAAGSFIAVMVDPLHLYSVLPGEIAANVDPAQLGQGKDHIDSAAVSAQIMTNNMRVAVLAFVGGITLGTLTIYLMVFNGMMLGGLAALFWQSGKFYDFWAYIVPHGMLELTAIFIAGGSGLLMGYRILVPGPYARALQLKVQSLRSVQLLLGTLPLFVIAGIVEGYITPAPIPLEAKYAFAFLTVIVLLLYVWVGARGRKSEDSLTISPD